MIKNNLVVLLFLSFLAISCGEDEPNLAPPAERVAAAIQGLRDELVAPSNGWKIAYKPTNDAGAFFILLNFDEGGNVNIQSDLPVNDGEFRNQTITYRIDNSLGLELIFETYGVFHFLFELDQSTFGAEFEFLFDEKSGNNLIFRSKTDITDVTILVFEPAGTNDEDLFGIEIAQNLETFAEVGITDIDTRQQLILSDANISVFWAIDLEKRNINVEFAGIGETADEIITNQIILLDHSTSYSFEGDILILEEPFSFVLNGRNNQISQITLGEFESTGPSLCASGPNDNPTFVGESAGLGNIRVQNTALSSSGSGFTPSVYTVNSFFIFDEEDNSLSDEGAIIEKSFPTAVGFAFLYGVELNDPTIPIFSLGFIMDEGDLYFREFEATTTDINRVKVKLLDKYFYRTVPEGAPMPDGIEEALEEITDLIFQGGEYYAYEFPVDGVEVFQLFNPCNEFDFFLVR